MDIISQMRSAQKMAADFAAELRSAGVDDRVIASALFTQAGGLWREAFPKESDLRKVITHAAEVAITGISQPVGDD